MPPILPDLHPDSRALPADAQGERSRASRGRLKIFFGATAGVGKTYAMLEAGRRQRVERVDVVVGDVEPHGRAETESLLEGLETLPLRLSDPGALPDGLDLDAALARRPQLLLVDELAHSNPPGARHPKRWQDIDELLAAGIGVYTTLNVQHIESLKDVVAQITGVEVRETVPDRVFAEADEVEIIDLPPDELLARLAEGKVYVPEQAGQAAQAFFRKGNLIALRQLALRATAERVDAAMREYRDLHAIAQPWAAGERLLVCIGPDPLSERLVRSARRMATALNAHWLAVYVETPALAGLPQAARDPILRTLKLADQLGAETSNLSGESVAATVLDYARRHNVGKIVIGKPLRKGWRHRFRRSLVDEVIRDSGAIDVYVITGDATPAPTTSRLRFGRGSRWPAYLWSLLVVAVATLVSTQMNGFFERANIVMVYLLGIVLVAARFGRDPSLVATLLSVGLFDFLFVQPTYSFGISDTQYVITFAVMLTTALVISHLTAAGKRQASVARQRERRAAELYALSRELARRRSLGELAKFLCRHVGASVDGEAAVLMPDADGKIQDPTRFCDRGIERAAASIVRYPVPGNDLGIAQWAWDHHQKAGLATDTLASASAIYLPLNALQRCVGVLGLRPRDARQLQIPEQMHLVEAQVNLAAVAMERVQLAAAAQKATVRAETESLRNALMTAISEDFRTPLATIIRAASTLRDDDAPRAILLDTLLDAAERMNRMVGNLADLTRLSEGHVELRHDAFALDELAGTVLTRLHAVLAGHPVTLQVPNGLPMLHGDRAMIEQVLAKLLENVARHTPKGTAVDVSAHLESSAIKVAVRDHGPGFAPGEEQRVFERFHPTRSDGAQSGFRLGLAICKAIVEAHGGTISAARAAGGGAEFCFTLPLESEPAHSEPP